MFTKVDWIHYDVVRWLPLFWPLLFVCSYHVLVQSNTAFLPLQTQYPAVTFNAPVPPSPKGFCPIQKIFPPTRSALFFGAQSAHLGNLRHPPIGAPHRWDVLAIPGEASWDERREPRRFRRTKDRTWRQGWKAEHTQRWTTLDTTRHN